MPTNEEQKNLEVIGEYFTGYWGKGNAAIVDKLCADNCVINYPMHGPRYAKENAKEMLLEFKKVRTDLCKIGCVATYICSGFPRHFVPRLPTPLDCEWTLCGWALERSLNISTSRDKGED